MPPHAPRFGKAAVFSPSCTADHRALSRRGAGTTPPKKRIYHRRPWTTAWCQTPWLYYTSPEFVWDCMVHRRSCCIRGGLRAPPRAPPETDGLGAVSTPDTAHGSRFGEICGQYVNRRAIQGHSIAKCAHGRPTPTHTVLCRHIRRLFPSFPLPDKATRATHGNAWPHVTPLAANGGAVGKGEAR